jgi:hypothetical protein
MPARVAAVAARGTSAKAWLPRKQSGCSLRCSTLTTDCGVVRRISARNCSP